MFLIKLFGRWFLKYFGRSAAALISNDNIRELAIAVVKQTATKAIANAEKYAVAKAVLIDEAAAKYNIKIDTWDAGTLVNGACSGMRDELEKLAAQANAAIETAQDKAADALIKAADGNAVLGE